jgi:hypothetical protein
MEAGLSDRASKVLRAVLHEKAGMDLAETPDPALVADQLSLRELACVRNCGPITLAEIRDWVRSLGYELAFRSRTSATLAVYSRLAIGLNARAPWGHST